MVELDLSFLSFLALAFALGFVAGFTLRGLRRRRVEDMLQFFRQRDQEQDRKIANLEREVSDARGRLLSIRADQGKGEKASGELRSALEEAQRTISRLREELADRPPALPEQDPSDVETSAAALPPAGASSPPAPSSAPAPAPAAWPAGAVPNGKKPAKKGRLP
jgi:hypothetical protein